MAQLFLTKALKQKLLANGREDLVAILKDGNTPDHWPVVKFFNPVGAATWLVTSLADDEDQAFGLADLGMGTPELGYISLNELQSVKLRFGMKIERDYHFTAEGPISEYAAKAKIAGRIAA